MLAERPHRLDAPQFPPDAAPEAVLAWTFERYPRERVVITTAFGMEGCALIDLLAERNEPLTVHFIDTGFLFRETHELRQRLTLRYPLLRFIGVGTGLSVERQAALHGPELWRRNPDFCCQLRKLDPMAELLQGAQAWITGVRRDQAVTRAATPVVGWDPRWGVAKIAPLAGWSREQVWNHVVRRQVPINPLHFQGYPTIGCTHCTRPVAGSRPGDYSRAGRWAGREKTECGLHFAPPPPAVRTFIGIPAGVVR